MTTDNQPLTDPSEWLAKLAAARQHEDYLDMLVASRWLLNSEREHDNDGNDLLEVYVDALREVRRQYLGQANEFVRLADSSDPAQAEQHYRDALDLLEGNPIKEHVHGDQILAHQLCNAFWDDAAITERIDAIKAKREELRKVSIPISDFTNQQGSEPPTSHEAVHDTLAVGNVREQEIASEIASLQGQIKSLLQQPNHDSYKEALALFDQILTFDLPPEQRESFAKQQSRIAKEREAWLGQYDELRTALIITRIVDDQLVASRRMLNQGLEKHENGRDLLEIYVEALREVRQQCLRQANERVAFAQKDILLGTDLLQSSLLDTAKRRYNDALRILRGEQIKDRLLNDKALEEQIRTALLDNDAIRGRIDEIETSVQDLEKLTAQLVLVHDAYTKAEQAYNDKKYDEADNELERLQGRAPDFESRVIDSLQTRVRQRWENTTAAELDARLAQIKSALARHVDLEKIEQQVQDALKLEPNLQTERINALRADIRGILETVRQQQAQLSALLDAVSRDRSNGKYAAAELQARSILANYPTDERAQKLLATILTDQINGAILHAKDTLAAPELTTIEASLTQLAQAMTKLTDLDKEKQRSLQTKCDEVKEALEDERRELQLKVQTQAEANRLIEQSDSFAQSGEYVKARELLQQAREKAPTLASTIDEKLSQLNNDWRSTLKRRLRTALRIEPLDLTLAKGYLDTLLAEQLEDQETAALRRQVEHKVQRIQAEQYYAKGEYEQALKILKELDLDPATNKQYQQTLRAAARRKVESRSWQDALDLLDKVGLSDPDVALLRSQCRGEMALEKAEELLRQKDFSGSSQQLTAAAQEVYGNIQERAKQLQQQLTVMQRTYNRAKDLDEQAQQYYAAYSTTGDRNRIKEAIRVLDEALAIPELPDGDEQRLQIQTRRNEYLGTYEQQTSAERRRILEAAEQALRNATIENIEQAYQYYTDVLNLNPHQQDADAMRGLERVRVALRTLRNQIVEQVRQQLNLDGNNQRGIYPNALTQLLQNAEKAQRQPQIETQPHPELNKAIQELLEARSLCDRAERDLTSARTRWSQERTRGGTDFHPIELDLERARAHFQRHPYIHIELDNSSPESLTERVKTDQRYRTEVDRVTREIESLLKNESISIPTDLFQKLSQAEEEVYKTTIWIAEQTNQPRPPHNRDRYPQQYRILARIAQNINDLRKLEQEVTTLAEIRQHRSKRRVLEDLLVQLEPNNRFELHGTQMTELDDAQLEEIDKRLADGQAALELAKQEKTTASSAGGKRQWKLGIDAYERSRTQYELTIKTLRPILAILPEESPYRALNLTRSNAQEMLQDAEQSLQQLNAEQPWKLYEQRYQEARQALDSAKQALNSGDLVQARIQANEAKTADPSLSEEAERVIRDADAIEGEKPSSIGYIVLGILAAGLIGAAIFVGPGVYNWIVSFFFPAGMVFEYTAIWFTAGLE